MFEFSHLVLKKFLFLVFLRNGCLQNGFAADFCKSGKLRHGQVRAVSMWDHATQKRPVPRILAALS